MSNERGGRAAIDTGFWETAVAFEEGQCRLWHIGPVRFWVRRIAGEWFISYGRTGDNSEPPVVGSESEPPDDLQWNRYVAGHKAMISARPVLPDRPIVIRPASPVKILPGKGSQYYINLPVWVAIIEGSSGSQTLLAEHPGEPLSSTWFGSPDDGELCYSYTSDLYKKPEDREGLVLTAVCPLGIQNGSNGTLDFQRICVRVPHFHLYNGPRFLCTNELELVYRGAEQSQINFGDDVPAIEANLKHITPPRMPLNRNIIKKSFEYIRSLSWY